MSLCDIAPLSRQVTVGDNKIEVAGLSAEALQDLISSYRTEIQTVALTFAAASKAKKTFGQVFEGLDDKFAFTLTQGVIPTAIVWACREDRSSVQAVLKAEKAVRNLTFTDQLKLLKTAYDLTFPEGIPDFLKALGLATARDENETSSNTGSDE